MEKGEPRCLWAHLLRQFLWQRFRIGTVYTDIEIANNAKINHIMVSFTDHYDGISIDRLPWKIKIGKDSCTLIIVFYLSPISPQLQIIFFILLKTQTNNHSSASDWWEYTKFCLKKRVMRYFSKIPPLKKILHCQDRILFYEKHKNQSLFSKWQLRKHKI